MRCVFALLAMSLGAGCYFTGGGLGDAAGGADGRGDTRPAGDAAPHDRSEPADAAADLAYVIPDGPGTRQETGQHPDDVDAGQPSVQQRDPVIVGCADGTREGFVDDLNWPAIAGCAGQWNRAGVLGTNGPTCGRMAAAGGAACSVDDLCAEGWHLCRSPAEVARRSRSGCESAVPRGQRAFFVIAAGATSQGLCLADASAANDLHGCGNIGQPESPGCDPLDRRLGFADCLALGGWSCGSADQHLREATLVVKDGDSGGGALCCRD